MTRLSTESTIPRQRSVRPADPTKNPYASHGHCAIMRVGDGVMPRRINSRDRERMSVSEPVTRRIRIATSLVWSATLLLIALLLTRVVLMLTVGADGSGSSSNSFAALMYDVTKPLLGSFASAANIPVPISGFTHVLDIAAVLAIVAYFFTALALTKLTFWAGGCYALYSPGVFEAVRRRREAHAHVEARPAALPAWLPEESVVP
jgi:hypothetical protein